MAPDDVALLREVYEYWSRGDFLGTARYFAPDIVFALLGEDVPDFFSGGEHHGIEAMWEAESKFLDAWDDVRYTAEEFIDLGDRTLVLDRQVARGKGSGTPVERESAMVFTVRNGKISRLDCYWTREEAFEATA